MDMVTQLFQRVDTIAVSAIEVIYDSIATELLPVFTVALTAYIAYWGYEMLYGRAPLTAGAFLWRIFRIGLIYAVGFYWSDFSVLVVEVFTKTANGIATAICTGTGGTSCGAPETTVAAQLSNLFSTAMQAAKVIAASGGWGAAIGLSLMAIVLVLLTLIFVALAITYVLVGKIALFILLGLAPLFIAMALFEFSSALFSGWLRTCAQYAIVPAIVYGVLGFLLTLMTATVNNLGGITDVSSGLTVIAPFLILCLVGSFILPLSLSIAASIAGGHALHNALPGTAMRGVRDYAYWRIARGWRNGGGARSEPPALPPPHATITQGAATISPGAGSRDFSADPRAEQVAGALIEARVAQARARNREG